jgi:hypothetical protein
VTVNLVDAVSTQTAVAARQIRRVDKDLRALSPEFCECVAAEQLMIENLREEIRPFEVRRRAKKHVDGIEARK